MPSPFYIPASENYIPSSKNYFAASKNNIPTSENYIPAAENYFVVSKNNIPASEKMGICSTTLYKLSPCKSYRVTIAFLWNTFYITNYICTDAAPLEQFIKKKFNLGINDFYKRDVHLYFPII